jgi:hypothetical protein
MKHTYFHYLDILGAYIIVGHSAVLLSNGEILSAFTQREKSRS